MAKMSRPPEVGRFVHFEHVNFRYQDHRLAKAFFIYGLGFTVEPYRQATPRNMWINVGTQQFHLPLGEPMSWPGGFRSKGGRGQSVSC